MENITNYLKKSINSQFILDNNEEKKENEQFKNNLDNDASEVEYELIKNFSNGEYFYGFFDFNKYFLAFYSYRDIIFFLKNNFVEKFKIEEISGIKA